MGTSYSANFRLFGTTRAGGNADASAYTVATIPDGSSNTIMFAEQYAACAGNGNLWAFPGIDWGWNWTPAFANTRIFPATNAVGGAYEVPQPKPTQAACDKRRVQSAHSSTVQCALGDGSVRGISRSVSPLTWQYAILPDDGQVLGSDW